MFETGGLRGKAFIGERKKDVVKIGWKYLVE